MLDRKEYEDALFSQYMSARGIKGLSREDRYVREDLDGYFTELANERGHYLELLRTLDVNYNDENTIEVGKGNVDSVVADYNASIITPYGGLFEGRKAPVYEGRYAVIDGEIMMARGKDSKSQTFEELPITGGRIYITHNMYEPKCIKNWLELVTRDDVVIGVFGAIQDRDMSYKLNHVRNIASILDNGTYNLGTIDGHYFAAVRARQDVKILKKTLERINNNGRVR